MRVVCEVYFAGDRWRWRGQDRVFLDKKREQGSLVWDFRCVSLDELIVRESDSF